MDIPVYKITKNKDLAKNGEHIGVSRIAYTDKPAIMTKGLAFDEKKMKFADASKLRVVAPIMIPDINIYRFDEDGEYFCVFDKQTIEELFVDFQDHKDQGNIKASFNLDHDNSELAPSFILESWIVGKDTKADRSYSEFGIEVPAGSVMVVSQFRDAEYFQKEIVEAGRTGFSIEGFLGLSLSEQIKNKIIKNKTEIMKETKLQMPDGEYPLANGDTMIIKDGICEIKKAEKPATDAAPEEMKVTPVDELLKVKQEEIAAAIDVTPEAALAPEVAAPADDIKIDEAAILKVVQPALDEILKKIAEISAKCDSMDSGMEDGSVMSEVKHTVAEQKLSQKDKLEAIKNYIS